MSHQRKSWPLREARRSRTRHLEVLPTIGSSCLAQTGQHPWSMSGVEKRRRQRRPDARAPWHAGAVRSTSKWITEKSVGAAAEVGDQPGWRSPRATARMKKAARQQARKTWRMRSKPKGDSGAVACVNGRTASGGRGTDCRRLNRASTSTSRGGDRDADARARSSGKNKKNGLSEEDLEAPHAAEE